MGPLQHENICEPIFNILIFINYLNLVPDDPAIPPLLIEAKISFQHNPFRRVNDARQGGSHDRPQNRART